MLNQSENENDKSTPDDANTGEAPELAPALIRADENRRRVVTNAKESSVATRKKVRASKATTEKAASRKGTRLDDAKRAALEARVREVIAGKLTMSQVIKEFGVSPPTAYDIKKRLQGEAPAKRRGARKMLADAPPVARTVARKKASNVVAELIDRRIAELEAELAELRAERNKYK